MNAISAIIVDDEPLARARLRALLAECASDAGLPRVEVLAEAGSGEEAIALATELHPDVIFLDIRMPVLDGFDVVELLPAPRPAIVFVTAYDQHAIRAFEVHALDYLTKPVRLARLKETISHLSANRMAHRSEAGLRDLLGERPRTPLARLALHVGRKLRVVDVGEIRWIESRDKLVYVHTAAGAHVTDFTLDELEARLDPAAFLRIHRSHIASAAHIRELIPWFAGAWMVKLEDGTQLPVARRRVRVVREMLGGG